MKHVVYFFGLVKYVEPAYFYALLKVDVEEFVERDLIVVVAHDDSE